MPQFGMKSEQTRALFRSALGFFSAFSAYAGRRGIAAALLAGLGAALEGIGLAVLVPLLKMVVDGTPQRLPLLLAGFAALIVLRALVLWHRDVLLAELRIGFVEAQRTRLVARLIASPWQQLSSLRHAEINHLLSSDIVLTGACAHFMLQAGVSLCLLAMQWLLAFSFSPILAALTGVLLAVTGLAMLPHLARSRLLGRAVAEANLHLAGSGAAFLGGLKLAMSQNLQDRFADEFNRTLNGLMRRQVDFAREQSRAQLAFATLSSLAGAAAILVGTAWLAIPSPVLIVFVLVLARMTGPAAQLQQGAQQFANFLPSFEKIGALEAVLGAEAAPVQPDGPPPVGGMRFHKVSYRHPGGPGVFDLDLVIEPGEFVGISGPSGAGKTTFADLLVGLLVPDRGVISVGGRLLTAALRRQWRSTVAYAPQDSFLFPDSLRANLLWANPAANEHDITTALRVAGADSLLPRLDDVNGETGLLLSGGERQRIALARALLRRAPLLVLDEITSAIDLATERALLERISALPWRPAVILIAHRPESLALCSRVIEFAEGRITGERAQAPAHKRA
jgi:ATP-binding cassette subfamily C protein